MQINLPKHAIATHPIRKTIDGVSTYTQIFVKLNLDNAEESELARLLETQLENQNESEICVFDEETLCYSFSGLVRQVRPEEGVIVLEVSSGAVRYPRA